MKYIKIFENYIDANGWSDYVTPNVVLLMDGYCSGIHYNYEYIYTPK
jgi:hypothetical protein